MDHINNNLRRIGMIPSPRSPRRTRDISNNAPLMMEDTSGSGTTSGGGGGRQSPTTLTSDEQGNLLAPQLLEDDNVVRMGSVNPSVLSLHKYYEYHDYKTTLPKVLVLFCGGTLIMKENPDDGSLIVNEKDGTFVIVRLLMSVLLPRHASNPHNKIRVFLFFHTIAAIQLLLDMEPRLQSEVATLDVEFIDNIDSSSTLL